MESSAELILFLYPPYKEIRATSMQITQMFLFENPEVDQAKCYLDRSTWIHLRYPGRSILINSCSRLRRRKILNWDYFGCLEIYYYWGSHCCQMCHLPACLPRFLLPNLQKCSPSRTITPPIVSEKNDFCSSSIYYRKCITITW